MKVKSINRGSHWINSCLFLPLTDYCKTKCLHIVSFSARSCGHLPTNLHLLSLLFCQLYFPFPFTISELFSSVQFSRSVVSDSLRPHGLQHARPPRLVTSSQSVLKFMSIESGRPSNHLIFCRPLLLLPSIFSSIRVFSNESVLHIRWPKYWSFSFNISPSNEYSGLICFRMHRLDLLAVQGTLKMFSNTTVQA